MVKIKRLKGSSLIEVLCSSVIFMILFSIAMEGFVKLGMIVPTDNGMIEAEMAMKEVMEEYGNSIEIDCEVKTYSWGEIEGVVQELQDGFFIVKVDALIYKGYKQLSLKKLVWSGNNKKK